MTKQEREYVDKVVEIVLASTPEPPADFGTDLTERMTLPMIPLSYSKHRAIPQYILKVLFGEMPVPVSALSSDNGGKPDPASIFFRAYEDRGPDNQGKKVYFAGVTPDLYGDKYRPKVQRFFDRLLDPGKEGEGLPGRYQDLYFDLYWDLHLGVRGKAASGVPTRVGEEFNLILGLLGSTDESDVRRLIQATRFVVEHRDELDRWIRDRLDEAPDDSFAYYWLKNGMSPDDVTFEVFHNFLALSQWGNTLHQTMERLRSDLHPESEHIVVRETFRRIMAGGDDRPAGDNGGCPFTLLDHFVMELFRTIAPNDGSLSARPQNNQSGSEDDEQIVAVHRHKEISHDPMHWPDADDFNPDRYRGKKVSTQIDAAESERLGFPRCPFDKRDFETRDGRDTVVTNDAFGSVYSSHAGRTDPVLEYAGYAPFGFGYRRCPGELLTIEVIKDFLRKVHSEGIAFHKIPFDGTTATLAGERIPLGVDNMVRNDITYQRPPSC